MAPPGSLGSGFGEQVGRAVPKAPSDRLPPHKPTLALAHELAWRGPGARRNLHEASRAQPLSGPVLGFVIAGMTRGVAAKRTPPAPFGDGCEQRRALSSK